MRKFKINAGELKHPITIQRFTKTKDDDGIIVEQWTDLFNARAKKLNIRGDERLQGQAVGFNADCTFYIRYKELVTRADRIVYNGDVYNILAVNDVEDAHFWIELKCELKK